MNLNDTLTDMTVAELRKLAARFDITGRSKMAKAQLVRELADPDIADVVELAISVTETEEILADEDAVAAIEESDAETMDDLRALLANAEADAECERARRLAEYDAEEAETAATAAEPRRITMDVEHTGPRTATIDVFTRETGLIDYARAVKRGSVWELMANQNGKVITVKARTLRKLAKRWAAKRNDWALSIFVAKSY